MFIYDLAVLSIVVAFLIRHCGLTGLRPIEVATLAAAMLMILAIAIVPLPLGFLANVHVAAIVMGRIWPFMNSTTPVLTQSRASAMA